MLSGNAAFMPRSARERLAIFLVRSTLRTTLKPVLSPRVPIPWQRWWLTLLTRSNRPKDRVDIQGAALGGVTGEWVRPRQRKANGKSRGVILYLHGGAYCIGSPATHRRLTASLALATGLPIFVADYRLAPEHPFPAAVEDAVSAYRSLSAMGPVIIAGDSAGGGLSLATALALRQRQISLPVALLLFSPWIDLTLSALSHAAAKREPILSYAWLSACARYYLAGSDPAAPLASPIYGDLRGLPPILIQVGSDDLLHGDATRIRGALMSAGVTVRFETVPAHWHVFQLHAGMLAAADAAIQQAADFVLLKVQT
jgi:acetyl esterase/lipase